MAKNIVVCCDGTWNRFDKDKNTNIVKLCSCLVRSSDEQVVFYDPGVGTIAAEQWRTRVGRAWSRLLGGAFGFGVRQNLEEAYSFIAEHYKTGDRVFIFGFSRGAYTARALGAAIRWLGLLERQNDNLYPYMDEIFASRVPDPDKRGQTMPNFELFAKFRNNFARSVRIHFVGVWDTVASVGWFWNPIVIPSTSNNPIIDHIRHAVAIDERRKNFRHNLFKQASSAQDLKEVWFPGVHSDVGGGYDEGECGLSKLSLAWMLDEAEAQGLVINQQRRRRVLGEDGNTKYARASATGKLHDPFESRLWKIAQYMPRRSTRRIPSQAGDADAFEQYWDWSPKRHERFVSPEAILHQAVVARWNADPGYRPPNIADPGAHTIEPSKPRAGGASVG